MQDVSAACNTGILFLSENLIVMKKILFVTDTLDVQSFLPAQPRHSCYKDH